MGEGRETLLTWGNQTITKQNAYTDDKTIILIYKLCEQAT